MPTVYDAGPLTYHCVYVLCLLASLLGVRLDMASETGILGGLSSVEVCECPQGYSGSSCQV